MMDTKTFIDNYRKAFGEKAELPIAFWYSEQAVAQTTREGHCIFQRLNAVRQGKSISVTAENLPCGGGKFYCGFTEMPAFVPTFVSVKERYKQSPQLVEDMLEEVGVPRAKSHFLNFARIDEIESFEEAEGLLFYATPDMLSGLVTWATFDNNSPDAVSSLFGSGCANVVTFTVIENSKGGHRCFLGLFDPSARPYVESNIMSFTIPMSRFRVMYDTMPQSCLFDTHAWGKIRERINQ